MMKRNKFILAVFLGMLAPLSAAHASALFDGTAADAWSINPKTGQVVGYDLGNNWLNQFVANDFSAIDLTNGNAVLINSLPNSSVPMTPGQPSISLTGIGGPALSVGQAANNDLRLMPDTGTYNDTIEVKIIVSATLFAENSYQLLWSVGAQPQKSIELNSQTLAKSQDGYFTQSVFLATDGVYPVNVELKNPSGVTLVTAAATYTIEICVPPMDAQACADKKRRDSDGDGIPDIVELDIGLNPLTADWNADLDGDGWSEFDTWLRRFCLDPNTRQPLDGISCLDANGLPLDSDRDDWSDFDEILRGTNYLDPEPLIDGAVVAPPNQTPALPDLHFCAAGDTFYFNLAFESSADEVIFNIGADGSPYVSPVEFIAFNFDQDGNVTRQAPEVLTAGVPANDRWLDGLITNFNLESLAPGVWRIHGSIPVGANPFQTSDIVNTVAIREVVNGSITGTRILGQVVVTGNKADCETNADISELVDQQRLRFKDFPAATRLYEIEHVLDNGSMIIPPPAILTPDVQSQGAKQNELAGVVVQSYTATQDNIASVIVSVAADEAAGVDNITLNIWGDSLRGTLLLSQTLSNVVINKLTDNTISFLFEAIPQQVGQVYYLEFRKKKAKLVSTGVDSYAGGAVLEAAGLPVAGVDDLVFTTNYDESFVNGVGGTRSGMFWQNAVAASINGKLLYDSTKLLSSAEIAQASLTAAEIATRLRSDSVTLAFNNKLLPIMRLPAGDSVVVSATHRYEAPASDKYKAPSGYERNYKYWLPRQPDLTPETMLVDAGQGSWTTPEEWRNAFVAYLLPSLTQSSNPQLDVDSTLPINAIEAVLSEEVCPAGAVKATAVCSFDSAS